MKISLIVPMLNEEEGILDVLQGIDDQGIKPSEIIFVDAGSNDNTIKRIQNWNLAHPDILAKIFVSQDSLPGASRNLGVKEAQYDLIAFLDAGLKPKKDWLELLHAEISTGANGAWGSCYCKGNGFIGILSAAYSMGHGSHLSYVLPASMFRKNVFNQIGYMREDLRAGEDTLWRNSYFAFYGKPKCIDKAEVLYTHFPTTLVKTYMKWFLYSEHMIKAGVGYKQFYFYMTLFSSILILLLLNSLAGLILICVYFLLRGLIDPWRRSMLKPWWGINIHLCLIGPMFVLGLDFAKLLGFLRGIFVVHFFKTSPNVP